MFADASSLRRAPILLLVLTALVLVALIGCGKEEEVDPYVYTTLARVMDGDTTSAVVVGGTMTSPALFEIDAPATLEYAKGDVGMVRDGNRLEFMVGPDIEHNYGTWRNSVLGVQKRYSHGADTPHLFLKRTRNGEIISAVDSVESYILPSIFQASQQQIQTPGAPLPELSWQRASRIEEFFPQNEDDDLIEVQSMVENFVLVPPHDVSEDMAASLTPADYAWYVVFENSTFKMSDLGPGAKWMLEYLKANNLPLIGSFSISSIAERSDRRVIHEGLGHICGEMQVNWFKVANTYVRGQN